MDNKKNTSSLVIGLIVVLAVIVFGFVWIYFGAQGVIPNIGFGLSVSPIVMFVGLVVALIVLYFIYMSVFSKNKTKK